MGKRRGQVEAHKALNILLLKKKAVEGTQVERIQTFVKEGSLNCECHAPARAGEAEGRMKLSLFINQKGKLVMLYEAQVEGFEWSIKTIAQRD